MSNQLLRRALVALSAVFALVVVMVAPASAQPEPFEGEVTLLDFCVGDPADELCFEVPDPGSNGVCQETDDPTITVHLEDIVEDESATIVDVDLESASFVEIPEGSGDYFYAEMSSPSGSSGTVDLNADPQVEANVQLQGQFSSVTVVEPGECVVGPPVCQFLVNGGLELTGDYTGDLPPPFAEISVSGGGGPIDVDFNCVSAIAGQLEGEDATVNALDLEFN